MKKFITGIILLIIIVLSFGFVWLKSSALGAENNYFNRKLRSNFAAIPAFRKFLGLHYDGDGKADYLSGRYEKILIEVDVMNNLGMQLEALDTLTAKIQDLTSKSTSYIVSDRNVPYSRELSKEEIDKVVQKYRNHKSKDDTATIYLLYGSRDQDNPNLLGITHQEYGIVLFGDAISDFTRNNPKTSASYEASTVLHEFGHQIGLPHNGRPDCLMNEQVEEARIYLEKPEDVVIDFCEYEKEQIK